MNDSKTLVTTLFCARQDTDDDANKNLYADLLDLIVELSCAYRKGFDDGHARGVRDTHLQYGAADNKLPGPDA